MEKTKIAMLADDLRNMDTNLDTESCIGAFEDIVEKCYGYTRDGSVFAFLMHWNLVPDKYFYELYRHYLTQNESPRYYREFFKPDALGRDILEKVHQFNKRDTIWNPALISLLDEEGYLTIYHGHCKKTMRYSNSWTLDKNIARWFGNRNALFAGSQDYYVVTGKVLLKDIITYITEREEDEIVVFQKNVMVKAKEYFPKITQDTPSPFHGCTDTPFKEMARQFVLFADSSKA